MLACVTVYAGGGGCALTLLSGSDDAPDFADRVASLVAALQSCGYQCFETKIGGAGVLLHRWGDAARVFES